MQLNMYLTERGVCDFVSFDDRYFDEELRLKVISVNFNAEYFQAMCERVMAAKAYTYSMELILGINQTNN
jgi:hypothetical protein